jgi:hypothetical protein
LFAVVETWRAPRHQTRSMEPGHATSLGETEEHHEHDLPYIQMVRSDSARVHNGNSTQLRIDGRRWWWDEIRSVRSYSHGAESLNVTSTTLHKPGSTAWHRSNDCRTSIELTSPDSVSGRPHLLGLPLAYHWVSDVRARAWEYVRASAGHSRALDLTATLHRACAR